MEGENIQGKPGDNDTARIHRKSEIILWWSGWQVSMNIQTSTFESPQTYETASEQHTEAGWNRVTEAILAKRLQAVCSKQASSCQAQGVEVEGRPLMLEFLPVRLSLSFFLKSFLFQFLCWNSWNKAWRAGGPSIFMGWMMSMCPSCPQWKGTAEAKLFSLCSLDWILKSVAGGCTFCKQLWIVLARKCDFHLLTVGKLSQTLGLIGHWKCEAGEEIKSWGNGFVRDFPYSNVFDRLCCEAYPIATRWF